VSTWARTATLGLALLLAAGAGAWRVARRLDAIHELVSESFHDVRVLRAHALRVAATPGARDDDTSRGRCGTWAPADGQRTGR
jgi:hypothetical protein